MIAFWTVYLLVGVLIAVTVERIGLTNKRNLRGELIEPDNIDRALLALAWPAALSVTLLLASWFLSEVLGKFIGVLAGRKPHNTKDLGYTRERRNGVEK